MKVFTEMPHGYRWMTVDDMDATFDHPDWFIRVATRVINGQQMTGMAVKQDCMIEFGMDHDCDAEKV